MKCNRPHVSVAGVVFDTFAGIEHCLYGFKLGHPLGFAGWEFPGGKVEPEESVEHAVVREVLEETSILIQPHFLNCYVEDDNYLCLMFGGVPIDGELKLREPDKHREWKWFPCDQFPQPLIPYAKDALFTLGEVFYTPPENDLDHLYCMDSSLVELDIR